MSGGDLTTLHVWRVPRGRLPRVWWRMARDRTRLRTLPGVRFAKLLGTSRDFVNAEPTRWAAVVTWADEQRFEETPVARDWRGLAEGYCRLDLTAVASKGRWSGQEPFTKGPAETGLALALTRARLRTRRAAEFRRAIAPVAEASANADGLLAAFGIGEAPIGWQGTVSLWRTAADLVEFAYRHPAHRAVVAATPVRRWYAEELFTRFAVRGISGDREVLGEDDQEGAP